MTYSENSKLLNVDIYSAPLILKYGDLISLNSLEEIRVVDLKVRSEYRLYFKIRSKYNWYVLKKLLRFEPNYLNSYFTKGFYCVTFNVPNKYKDLVQIKHDITIDYISGKDVQNLLMFLNKKAPATIKQLRLFLFIFVKILIDIKIISSFFVEHLAFKIFSFTFNTYRTILFKFVMYRSS